MRTLSWARRSCCTAARLSGVFLGELPRLSVDLDLMYVGAVERAVMLRSRPGIDERFRAVVGKLGYAVRGTNHEHSGQTYKLRHDGDAIKIDISYLARVALLEPVLVTCAAADPPLSFVMLREPELWAGKVKALVERTAARDLYDLYRLAGSSPHFLRNDLARALVIRAISASHAFPSVGHPADALDRFSTPAPDLADPLYAMLAIDDRPSFAEMIAAVTALFEPLRNPSDDEAEYVRLLGHESEYRPELLFRRWPAVLERARLDPAMQWKVMNLRRRTP